MRKSILFFFALLTAPLFAINCELYYARISRAGLLRWDNIQAGTRPWKDILVLATHVALTNYQDKHPHIRELSEILGLNPEASLSDGKTTGRLGGMPARLDHWLKKNEIPVEFVWLDELPALAQKYRAAGLLGMFEDRIASDNGFMSLQFWNLLVNDGKLPIIDPHDVVTHAASLKIPGVWNAIQKKAAFQLKLNKYFGREFLSMRGAPGAVQTHFTRNIRSVTWENLSFIEKDNSGIPHLVLHGNYSLRVITNLLSKVGAAPTATELLGGSNEQELEELPRFDDYTEKRPSAYNKLRAALVKIAAPGTPANRTAHQKIRRALEKGTEKAAMIQDEHQKNIAILDYLALVIEEDKQLKDIFNVKNRNDVVDASIAFYEDYLSWLESEVKK